MSGAQNGDGKRGRPSDAEVAARRSMLYRVPTINLAEYEIARDVLDLVPEDLCRKHTLIPVSRAESSLIVAMVDPTDAAALEALKAHTGMRVEAVISTELAIFAALAKYHGPSR